MNYYLKSFIRRPSRSVMMVLVESDDRDYWPTGGSWYLVACDEVHEFEAHVVRDRLNKR